MAKYSYTARDAMGNKVKGSVKALDEREAVLFLRSKGLIAERIKGGTLNISIGGGGKVKLKELMSFTRMMATFTKASVPLNSALNSMQKQAESEDMKRVIQRLSISVESGQSLSDACKEQPKVFDTIFINMLAAGEASGDLAELMERLAEMMEKNEEVRSKVKGAMTMPIIVSVVATLAIVILLTFVLPQFIKMFAESGVALPLPTRLTIGTSELIRHKGHYIAAAIGAFVYGYKRLMKNPKAAYKKDELLLKMPVFGMLILKSTVSRFSRTMSTLITAGVTIVDALTLVERTTANRVVARAFATTRVAISSGKQLAETLDKTGVFPPMVTSMVAVGENTGGLSEMLSKVADYYEVEVNRSVDSAIKLIEPAMMVVFGGLVLIILLSIYMPMFNMLAVLKE